jgi:hypothetical protein
VPAAQCPGGYLIGWVVDPAYDTPIKFDGLIDSADLRNVPPAPNFAFALASDPAIPIQANPALANGAPLRPAALAVSSSTTALAITRRSPEASLEMLGIRKQALPVPRRSSLC